MTISGTSKVSGAGAGASAGQSGVGNNADPVSKELQDKIARAQKQLQELSANTELSAETKMKKRQELQKQISDLNVQLRQHQIEQRKKEREKKDSFDDMLGTKPQESKADGKGQAAAVPSQANMEAMISAGAAMDQAKVHGSVATKMESRAGILEAEIKLDSGRGGSSNIESKKAELAEVEEKAMEATASQMGSLAEVNKTLEEASKKEQEEQTEEEKAVGNTGKDTKTPEAAGVQGTEQTGSVASPGEEQSQQSQQAQEAIGGGAPQLAPVVHYRPVDVRL